MSIATIEAPNEVQAIQAKTSPWPDKARAFVIDSDEQYTAAGEELLAIHALKREAEKTFEPMKEKAWAAHKEIVAQEKRIIQPLEEAARLFGAKMTEFKAERQRLADEQRRRDEAAALEEARRKREADLKQLEEEKASVEEYVAVAEAPLRVAPVAPPPVTPVPKVAGIANVQGKWKGRVTDKAKLIRAIAAREHLDHLLDVNESALNRYAQSLQKAAALDGVEFYQEAPGIRPSGR